VIPCIADGKSPSLARGGEHPTIFTFLSLSPPGMPGQSTAATPSPPRRSPQKPKGKAPADENARLENLPDPMVIRVEGMMW
jgi:hypothetical protein